MYEMSCIHFSGVKAVSVQKKEQGLDTIHVAGEEWEIAGRVRKGKTHRHGRHGKVQRVIRMQEGWERGVAKGAAGQPARNRGQRGAQGSHSDISWPRPQGLGLTGFLTVHE